MADDLIVPSMRTIRETTLLRLEQFRAQGGQVIFSGEIPSLIGAVPSQRVREFAQNCQFIKMMQSEMLGALDAYREVDIHLPYYKAKKPVVGGGRADSILHQIRTEGELRYIFFCNTDKKSERSGATIRLKGEWEITVLDTLHGEIFSLEAQVHAGWTQIRWDFPAHGSLLLKLVPEEITSGVVTLHAPGSQTRSVQRDAGARKATPLPGFPTGNLWEDDTYCPDPQSITLSEPNVLLLDQAEYQLDDEGWQMSEEVLRIENIVRRRLGYPLKMAAIAQPWTITQPAHIEHTVRLRFTLQTKIPVTAAQLALEAATQTEIRLDGQLIPSEVTSWFVDEAIQTVFLPELATGIHTLELTLPFGPLTNLEWCYLLGDFGVQVAGRSAWITEPVRTLAFGDWTHQGLPFYAGNVTYHCNIEGKETALALRTPKFKSPLLSVELDGESIGKIAFAPFRIELGPLADGPHILDITAYGNRINAFGCLHNADETWDWFGPGAWRTTGDAWSYEYQLKPMGLLVAPHLEHPMGL